MTDQPLSPIQSPLATFQNLGLTLPNLPWLEGFLIAVFVIWAIFTIISIYHWLRYSHASLLAFPAIFIHLVVSAGIMSYALTGDPRGLFL